MSLLVAYPGTLNRFRVTLRGDDGLPLALDPADPLEATAWAGDDQAAQADLPLAVAFEEDDRGASLAGVGRVVLSVDLTPGDPPEEGVYAARIAVGGPPEEGWRGHVEVVNAPGAGSPPKVYASHDAMRGISDQVDALFNTATGRAGFLEERGDARDEIDRRIADGWRPRPGFVYRRVAAFDPVCGFDRPDASLSPPDRDGLRDLLAADALIPDDRLREMASVLAVALVLERQLTGGRNPYQEEGAALRARFDAAMRRYRPRLDVTVAGNPAVLELGHDTATFHGLPES